MDYRHPPPTKSRHAHIVHELGIRIVSGELRPGDRMPNEASLCEHYQVSRPVLREATRVLVAKGLVVSKPRVGSVVRPRGEWHLLDPDVLYWLTSTMPAGAFFETLVGVRRIIEPAAAALAAKTATDDELDAIEAAYQRMESAATRAELLEPDLEFHRRVVEATHNDLLAYIGNMLSIAIRESIRLSSRHPNTHALSLPRHKAILTALRNRDPLGARQASLVQLESAREDVGEILDLAGGETEASPARTPAPHGVPTA
jgi:DNA-binding FadR family transcriptional regulator